MRFAPKTPPRRFTVGKTRDIEISDCGCIHLEPDEQVTFTTPDGGEYDVARKDWGFYATPSLESRLPKFGLRPALARNAAGQTFILLVEAGKEGAFARYLEDEAMHLIRWLDTGLDGTV